MSATCVVWPLFLGAALAGPFYWIIQRPPARIAPPVPPRPPRQFSRILYLSPASAAALGPCASPARLRKMTADCIKRRLQRIGSADSNGMPSRGQYASWPEQARLLCAGKQDELDAFQKKLMEHFGEPLRPAAPPIAQPALGREISEPLHLMALALGFAFIAWMAWMNCLPCAVVSPPAPPVVIPIPIPIPLPAPVPAPDPVRIPPPPPAPATLSAPNPGPARLHHQVIKAGLVVPVFLSMSRSNE